MQAFGRMRLDVENCLQELVESGVVRRVAGDPVAYTAARLDARRPLGRLLDTFLERRAAVGIEDTSPVGAALPRDDRPRREDAGHLRVDPHRRQVATSRC